MSSPMAEEPQSRFVGTCDRPTVTEATPLLASSDSYVGSSPENASKTHMFWQELRILPRYAMPIFGTQIIEHSFTFVPVLFVGHISTDSLAAITLGSMTATVTGFSLVQGLVSALDTLLPSTWTSSEPHLLGLWAQRMWVVLTIATIPIIFVWFHAETILLALKQDPDVAHLAAMYLRYFSFGLPAYCFNLISRRYFQAQGLLGLQTSIICSVAPVNMLLNYLLVLGPEPIRLGFIGAPIATVLSLSLVSCLSILCGILYVPRMGWHPISSRMFTNLGVVWRLGLSGVGQIASEWWAWECVALLSSFLGPIALASQSILLTSCVMLFRAVSSISEATAIRVGNLLGEQKSKRAEVAAYTAIILAFFTSSITCTIFITVRHSWAYMFNDDPDVAKTVAVVIPVIALNQIIDGNAVVTAAIMRAKGDQFIGGMINFGAYYFLGLPIGAWLAFRGGFELRGLWMGLSIALVLCASYGSYLCLTTDWEWEVEKVLVRLRKERLKGVNEDEEQRID